MNCLRKKKCMKRYFDMSNDGNSGRKCSPGNVSIRLNISDSFMLERILRNLRTDGGC